MVMAVPDTEMASAVADDKPERPATDFPPEDPEDGSLINLADRDLDCTEGESPPDELEEEKQQEAPKPLTRTQIVTLVIIGFTTISTGSLHSFFGPFFTTEAHNKGATPIQIGFIFSSYHAMFVLMSPIFGKSIVTIGPKFMYVTGVFVSSTTSILFGILEWCPGGTVYVLLGIVLCGVEGMGASASVTAARAIAATTFPNSIAKVMGLIDICSYVGLSVGPPIGGLLFEAGGFHMPFCVTGALFLVGGLVSGIFMPSQRAEIQTSTSNYWVLLTIPAIYIVGYMVFICQATMGFLIVGMAPELTKFTENKTIIGLIFLVPTLFVILLVPLNGYIVDKNKIYAKPIIIMGMAVGTVGLFGLGPSPLMPYLPRDTIWTPIIAFAITGMGWSALVVAYKEFVGAAQDAGIVITMEMQGIIAGTYGALESFGALAGPVLGGLLIDQLGFAWAATFWGLAGALVSVLMFIYCMITMVNWNSLCSSCCSKPEPTEDESSIVNNAVYGTY